jgi:hypothetical protein
MAIPGRASPSTSGKDVVEDAPVPPAVTDGLVVDVVVEVVVDAEAAGST